MEDAVAQLGSVDIVVIIVHHPVTDATTMDTVIHQPLWTDPCSSATTIQIATKSLIHTTITYNVLMKFIFS